MQTKQGQPILQTEQPRIRPSKRVILEKKKKTYQTLGTVPTVHTCMRPGKESEEKR
jgi:hypothetical protein